MPVKALAFFFPTLFCSTVWKLSTPWYFTLYDAHKQHGCFYRTRNQHGRYKERHETFFSVSYLPNFSFCLPPRWSYFQCCPPFVHRLYFALISWISSCLFLIYLFFIRSLTSLLILKACYKQKTLAFIVFTAGSGSRRLAPLLSRSLALSLPFCAISLGDLACRMHVFALSERLNYSALFIALLISEPVSRACHVNNISLSAPLPSYFPLFFLHSYILEHVFIENAWNVEFHLIALVFCRLELYAYYLVVASCIWFGSFIFPV